MAGAVAAATVMVLPVAGAAPVFAGTGTDRAMSDGPGAPTQPAKEDQSEPRESVVEPRIVGGGPATVGEYPYFVSVQTATGSHFCGGSLVSATRVLTAAHCVEGKLPAGLRVVIGRTALFEASQGIIRSISAINIHPSWSSVTFRHDVAILTLASPVTNADNTNAAIEWLRLADPAESSLFEPDDPATVIGHGATSEGGLGSSTLLEVSVPVQSDATMSSPSVYGSSFDGPTMIGAGPLSGGQDSCQGDSGGPLLVPVDGVDIQIGDVSWGDGCARRDRPGIYGEVWQGALRTFVDAQVARPANDRFAASQTLTGNRGSVSGDTTSATNEAGETPLHETSVWYSWTPSASGPATVSTSNPDFDSTLRIYTGSALAGLTPVAGNDDAAGSLQSSASFTATAGTTYRIAVDGYAFAFGPFTLDYAVTPPSVAIGDVVVPEGQAGTRSGLFTVSLDRPSADTVTVAYATADAGAAAGSDYTARSGSVTLAAGSTSATIKVPVAGDTIDESDESFTVGLSAPAGVDVADGTGTARIVDDDPTAVTGRSIAVGDVSVHEGDAGGRTAVFTLSLSKPSTSTVTVVFATANGTALKPGDYTGKSGIASFAPGVTGAAVKVWVNADAVAEGDETFALELSSPSGAVIADGLGSATILDDD